MTTLLTSRRQSRIPEGRASPPPPPPVSRRGQPQHAPISDFGIAEMHGAVLGRTHGRRGAEERGGRVPFSTRLAYLRTHSLKASPTKPPFSSPAVREQHDRPGGCVGRSCELEEVPVGRAGARLAPPQSRHGGDGGATATPPVRLASTDTPMRDSGCAKERPVANGT
eukprot:363506-Chlamydomonas_euryale.AAC.2